MASPKYIRPAVRNLGASLGRINTRIEDKHFDMSIDQPLSQDEKEFLAPLVNELTSNGLTLAWKYGMSEIPGIDTSSEVFDGGKLTTLGLITQLIRMNRDDRIGFGEELRALTDMVEGRRYE
jgi:hypothetical protein